jgi:hypothetical protein
MASVAVFIALFQIEKLLYSGAAASHEEYWVSHKISTIRMFNLYFGLFGFL